MSMILKKDSRLTNPAKYDILTQKKKNAAAVRGDILWQYTVTTERAPPNRISAGA